MLLLKPLQQENFHNMGIIYYHLLRQLNPFLPTTNYMNRDK